MTSGFNERPYLSIGEVLGLLLEEFPDITISKIRFLESQGLIEPERTASGYRKFFDADIDRLRVILREQRENFLPLRVIRDRLETGEIDDSGPIAVPVFDAGRVVEAVVVETIVVETTAFETTAFETTAFETTAFDNVSQFTRAGRSSPVDDLDLDDTAGILLDDPTGTISVDAQRVVTNRHPAAQGRPLVSVAPAPAAAANTSRTLRAASGPTEIYDRSELCALGGVTASQLTELESFGLVSGRGPASSTTFTDTDVAIVQAAAGFLARGIDARHLRGWRQSAEREAGLFEQRILPLLRQRNPQARHDAAQLLGELADLGAELRQAMIVAHLRHHLDT